MNIIDLYKRFLAMLRDVNFEDISDGFVYKPDDLVNVGCNECMGCSDCCRITGDSIILDPYDIYNLCKGLGRSFADMMEKEIEIRLVDNLILPNLITYDEDHPDKEEKCAFLNDENRCTVHAFRPGFCRLFPMGRLYDENGMHYFLQVNECTRPGAQRYPVKLRDWIGIENLAQYEKFVVSWHDFCKKMGEALTKVPEPKRTNTARYILQVFYVEPYKVGMSFWDQFDRRLAEVSARLGIR
jgi:Fe-S-cluster containining protein